MTVTRILVNSCLKFYKTTLPPLLESLRNDGVPRDLVHVVIGEADERRSEVIDDVHHHYVPYASMDNNALIWAALDDGVAQPGDWWFYLHDTCTVERGFWGKVTAKVSDASFSTTFRAARVLPTNSMCIGLYVVEALRHATTRAELKRVTNLDRSPERILALKRNLAEVEDFVFNIIAKHAKVHVFANQYRATETSQHPYGTNTKRIREDYPDPGIVKWKANWGKKPMHLAL